MPDVTPASDRIGADARRDGGPTTRPRRSRLSFAHRVISVLTGTAVDDDTSSRGGYSPVALLAGLLTVGLMIAATIGVLVLHLRDEAITQAMREQRHLSLILADQAERAFEAVELVQTALVARTARDGIANAVAFRWYAAEASMHEELRGRGGALPQLDAIDIIDADGDLINSSRGMSDARVNVADRAYFQTLKADPDRAEVFSDPVANRADGKVTALLARRVSGPKGEFLGLILGAVNLSYFEELYREVAPGRHSSIALRQLNGTLWARFPPVDVLAMRQAPIRGPSVVSANGSVLRQVSPIDGTERLISDCSLTNYPIVVGVTNTIDAILTDWRQQAAYLGFAALALETMVVGIGLLMWRRLRYHRLLHEARAARAEAEAAHASAAAELAVARERERAEGEQRQQNRRFSAALSNMSQALFMFDQTSTLVVVNERAAELFGLPPGSLRPGMTHEELRVLFTARSNLRPEEVETIYTGARELRAAGKRTRGFRELADGRTLASSFVPIENDGWLATLEDITTQRRSEARISHMAQHDALTGLPNRLLFLDRLREAIARSRRGEPCAVLYLDLDQFKDVNDTLGHPVGDELLRAVTLRLLARVREVDTVARLGGDEFAIVQYGVDQPNDAQVLAERLIETFHEPYEVGPHLVMIGTSIGIAIIPTDGEDAEEIMKNADLALYSAKADGRCRYRFFEPEMDAAMRERRTMEIDLRNALTAGEFELFYQPLMNLKNGEISGFEALIRWFHPRRGLIQPTDFIPLSEEIGLVVPLGEWALRRACQDAASWPGDVKVAVNVSVVQFAAGTLVADVSRALRESGLDPSRLELEITETVMLNDTDTTLMVLYQLRDLGVGIAMDDFGTGYSSLSYLRRFPFSKVKIDRSFIADLGKDGGSDAIVAAVTELCETLGMLTLAEGVETEEQLRLLRAGNCGEAQGYLFSRPRPAHEVAEMCHRLGQKAMAEAAS